MLALVRARKKKPVTIGSRNTELFVQTVYYKDNPRAAWNMILILLMVAIAFVSIIFIETTIAVTLIAIMFFFPVYAAISGKTWFSFNATHDKPLIFEPDALQLCDEYFVLQDINEISIYVDGFYGFRIPNMPGIASDDYLHRLLAGARNSSYGDQNELRFKHGSHEYACRFLLGSGIAWMALYEIIKAWQQQSKPVNLKEAIPYHIALHAIEVTAEYYKR
jgi:hypothetical protein